MRLTITNHTKHASDRNAEAKHTDSLPCAAWDLQAEKATMTSLWSTLAALPPKKPLPKRYVAAWTQAAQDSPILESLHDARRIVAPSLKKDVPLVDVHF